MAFAAPVTIAPAGSGGVLTATGGMGGVEGLFAALLGMGADGVMTGQVAVAGAAPGEEGGAQAGRGQDSASSGLIETLLPLAKDAQVKVQGDGGVVAAFAQRVQGLYQQVIESGMLTVGGDDSTKQLAAALQKMGVPPEEAAGIAEQIDTMLKMVEQQQGEPLSDDEKASLAAMMLAALVPQNGQAFDVQISAKESQATVSVAQVDDAFKKGKVMSAADVARQMAGMAAQAKDGKGEVDAAAVPPKESRKGEKPAVFKIDVTHTDDGEAAVTVTLPDMAKPVAEAKAAHTDPLAENTNPAALAQEARLAAQDVQRVDGDKVIERAKGDTVYKLQADKDGVETLQAVRPVSDNTAAAALAAQGQHTAAAPQGTAQAGDGMAFAERLALAQRNHVAQQVNLQVKPLLNDGGGQVRMTLNPPELGRITIDLQVSDGKVHGAIAASDPAVVEQLARELHNLRHGLADAGLKLGDQGISLMLNNSNQFAQGQSHGHGQQAARGGSAVRVEGMDGADVLAEASAWVAPERVLDVKI